VTERSLRGVIAAVATVIDANGTPDHARSLKLARYLLDNGCDGLNVLGTTGEATSFSREERMGLMSAYRDNGLPMQRLMGGTGTPDLATTIAPPRHAHELGFAGALVLPPYYYKGVSDDGLFAWFERLIEGTADAAIDIYLYNFPQMTGIRFSPELARRLKTAFPERMAGAKDSSGDLAYAAELAKIDGFAVFPSSETALGRAKADGYAGCISATVSVTAPLVAAYWREPTNAALAEKVAQARASISAQPLIPAVKYLVAQLHGDPAFERVLPPHLPLTQEQKSALSGLERAAA